MAEGPASGAAVLGKAASSSGPDPLIGRVINDRFRVVAMMAKGGMGKVYRAEQAPLGREVALKVLNPSYSGDQDPEFHKRFFLEASTCSKLTHPNTVTIFDYGRSDDDIYYIAMELLEGRTLHRALREEGPFAPARALHIARQIARSLREAHMLGVIHRDLKPANVFLVRHSDENDFVKVLDFGLVKSVDDKGEDLTQTGLFMGSPKYMSPEQIRGERADARADIYSLGVILYEMLVGKVPFDRSSSVNILMAHVHEPPPPFATANPNVAHPPALEAVVMRALSKNADDRYTTMDDVLVALKNISTESGSLLNSGALLGASDVRPSIETGVTGGFRTHGTTSSTSGPAAMLSSSGSVAVLSASSPSGSVVAAPISGSDAASTMPPKAAPSIGPWIGVGVLALVVVAAGLWMFGGSDTPTAPGTSATLPTVPTPPVTPPVVEPAAPLRTTVSLASEPVGATVHVGEATYGPTPVEVIWEGEDATRGREVTFVFELDGHRSMTVLRTVSGETLSVSATLDRLPTARPVRPRPPRTPGGGGGDDDGPIGPVHGYKTDPY